MEYKILKKIIICLIPFLLIFLITNYIQTNFLTSSPSDSIPSNASVSTAWEGYMCEANGKIYFVSAYKSKDRIVCMEFDGKNKTFVSEKYNYICDLATDNSNIYFRANSETGEKDTIYCLSTNGGKEHAIAKGHIYSLQYAKGRLYWIDDYSPYEETKADQKTTTKIYSINSDGSDLQTVFLSKMHAYGDMQLIFLATDEGLYYSLVSPDNHHCNIFFMDLDGKNNIKINKDELNRIDKLFFDQGKLYFLMQHLDDTFTDSFSDLMVTIDKMGKTRTIKNVGFFPMDFGCVEYCGISNNIIYYFVLQHYNKRSNGLIADLHQYDIKNRSDTTILRDIDMSDNSVGTLNSVRGVKIMNKGTTGMYILGNDIYFSPQRLP